MMAQHVNNATNTTTMQHAEKKTCVSVDSFASHAGKLFIAENASPVMVVIVQHHCARSV